MEIRILLVLAVVISNLWVLWSLDNNKDNAYISPMDISIDKHFWGAFGNYETEISARWIVRFCRERKSWRPFTRRDLTDFYINTMGRKESVWLNGLDDEKYLTEKADNKGNSWIKVTPLFITKCHASTLK